MKLIVKDNYRDYVINDQQAIDDLRHIADCPLDRLTDKDCNDVWVFPSKENRYDDKIEDETILSVYGNKISTGNIMGFIGYGDTELTIRSRFSSEYSISEEYILAYSATVSMSPAAPWVRSSAAIMRQLRQAKATLEPMSPSSRAANK